MAKSLEEYQIKWEESLLKKLEEGYGTINRTLFFIYAVLATFILLYYKMIDGIKYSSYVLTLSSDDRLFLIPLFILIPYLMINHNIRSTESILRKLNANTISLKTVNPDAIAFELSELEIYSIGIAGLQYQFAQWIARKSFQLDKYNISFPIPIERNLVTKIRFTWTLTNWVFRLSSLIISTILNYFLMVIVYVLPLFIIAFIIDSQKIHWIIFDSSKKDFSVKHLIAVIAILTMACYTFFTNLKLSIFYTQELKQVSNQIKTNYLKDFRRGILKIYRYYHPKKE